MPLVSDREFIAEVKERIATATFLEATVNWDFYRAKFECLSKTGTRYHLQLRIVSFEDDEVVSASLDTPRTSLTVRSNHLFLHKLKERIVQLAKCED